MTYSHHHQSSLSLTHPLKCCPLKCCPLPLQWTTSSHRQHSNNLGSQATPLPATLTSALRTATRHKRRVQMMTLHTHPITVISCHRTKSPMRSPTRSLQTNIMPTTPQWQGIGVWLHRGVWPVQRAVDVAVMVWRTVEWTVRMESRVSSWGLIRKKVWHLTLTHCGTDMRGRGLRRRKGRGLATTHQVVIHFLMKQPQDHTPQLYTPHPWQHVNLP